MTKLVVMFFAITGVGLVLAGVSLARDGDNDRNGRVSARLDGYQETPASISTDAEGSFEARIGSSVIQFELEYEGLEGGNVLFAHIHVGQQHTSGGVSAFLCGGGGKPACPNSPDGTVEGTITAANVQGPAGQGIATGELDELVAAIRAGAAYVNVHTATFPTGELRGQLGKGSRGRGDGDKDD